MKRIAEFQEEFRFLSNFWGAPVILDGIVFPSIEHAYQAAKTTNIEKRKQIATLTAGQAKRAGSKVQLRADWETIKLSVMEELVRQKFTKHIGLRKALLATGDAELIEGNTWGDTFWGVCRGKGENHLGKILMKVREELK